MPAPAPGPLLAIDSGSPLLSVAVGWPDDLLATHCSRASRSSTTLMRLLDATLAEARVDPASLGGVLVLSGPGSFTGLRVGMSVAIGLHQAIGLAAGALPTFTALTRQAPEPSRPIMALVKALRSEWHVQTVAGPGQPPGPAARMSDSKLLEQTSCQLVGFDTEELAGRSPEGSELTWISPRPLAEVALDLADLADWSVDALTSPVYMAPPPVRRAARRNL